jgi:hypothetical protein
MLPEKYFSDRGIDPEASFFIALMLSSSLRRRKESAGGFEARADWEVIKVMIEEDVFES